MPIAVMSKQLDFQHQAKEESSCHRNRFKNDRTQAVHLPADVCFYANVKNNELERVTGLQLKNWIKPT